MRSANEISSMVLKAARGAGLPLGCAEELARAAPLLSSTGNLPCVLEALGRPCEAPILDQGVVRGGHPVQAVIAWQDLSAAGVSVKLECNVDAALLDAMCSPKKVVGPFEVDESLWSTFAQYAAKMLVPESEASRLAGAGAGLSDND
ncbi:DUF3726 domain-containing protein [Planktotalea sp.]|uniref:DUF3726 domain-containing protein n=1 Tax=Planktotalea sp. TaxID=2029877 RepID=UPI0035C7FFFD